MIGIFFRQDVTQVVRSVENKGVTHIVSTAELPAAFDWVVKSDVEVLASIFKEAISKFGVVHEEFYVSLPDELFELDCGPYEAGIENEDEDTKRKWAANFLHTDPNGSEFGFPFELRKRASRIVTCCALKKSIRSALTDAVKAAGQNIILIEPAMASYLRYLNDWEREHCFLEVFNTAMVIMSFSPVFGAFKLPLPDYDWNRIEGFDSINFSMMIDQIIAQHDSTAYQTFNGVANTDIKIHLISPFQERLLTSETLRQRLAGMPGEQPYIQSDLTKEELHELIVPIGAVLQPVEEVMCSAFTQIM